MKLEIRLFHGRVGQSDEESRWSVTPPPLPLFISLNEIKNFILFFFFQRIPGFQSREIKEDTPWHNNPSANSTCYTSSNHV